MTGDCLDGNLRSTSLGSTSGAIALASPAKEDGGAWEAAPAPLGGWPKRMVDVTFAAAGLVAAAPLMLLVALLIKAVDRGPVFYGHDRVGFGGRPFRCYKFRSMATDADALLARLLACDAAAAREWHETQKLRHDPRVSALGMLLRRSSLDELPQLYNILRGDMSCVGPRPIVRAELERYGANAAEYLSARPGLTGIWQVTGRSSAEYATRVRLDTGYVRGWSLRGDFIILLRTSRALFRVGEAC